MGKNDGSFMKAYRDKGRVSPTLKNVPLFFVLGDDMGQRGARLRAVRLLREYQESTPGLLPVGSPTRASMVERGKHKKEELAAPRGLDMNIEKIAKDIAVYKALESQIARPANESSAAICHEP